MINEIFKCYGDTFYLLTTLRLPPSLPATGTPEPAAPECPNAPLQDGWVRVLLRRWVLRLAVAPIVQRLRFAASSSGVTTSPTKTV